MNILISNDDGVHAKGINILAAELEKVANITVVAPDRNRSGASNSLTLNSPLRAKKMQNGFISIEGTPTDCVHLALTGLLDQKFDMVVSGINNDANLGDDVLYSGTVAAATEGRFLGLPAVAVSLAYQSGGHFETAAVLTRRLVERLSKEPLPASTILNVNVPDVPLTQVKGFEITRLGTRHAAEPTIKTTDPRGQTIYWIGPPGAEQDAGPGTDFHAIHNEFVSITPMKVDHTNYKSFEQLSAWASGLKVEETIS